MPWDGTELWVARIGSEGGLGDATLVAGGVEESIYQPGWLADGSLLFASDRDGWWRLFRAAAPFTAVSPLLRHAAGRCRSSGGRSGSSARPRGPAPAPTGWSCRSRRTVDGTWVEWTCRPATLTPIAPDLQPDEWLAASPSQVVLVAGQSRAADAVMTVPLDGGDAVTLKRASDVELEPGSVSVAEPIEFTTGNGRSAHAFYYAPRNAACDAPATGRPPLIVIGHGGPIAAADPTFDLKIQFWTTRGFAVVDVNYRRQHRVRTRLPAPLNGQWGIVDVEDLINAARHLVAAGQADGRRLAIRGRQRRGIHGAGRADRGIPRCSRREPATTASAIWRR